MSKLARDRIINLKLYYTVNENVVLIFLLFGYIRQRNGETKNRLKYLYETVLHRCRVWPVSMNIKQLADDYISACDKIKKELFSLLKKYSKS